MKAVVCNRWELPIMDGLLETVANEGIFERPYYVLAKKKAHDIGAEAWAMEFMFEDLPKVPLSVVEFFGGIGMTSLIIEGLLKPTPHIALDIDPGCVSQIKHAFNNKVYAKVIDAKEAMLATVGEIYSLDFNTFTALRFSEWEEQFNALFEKKPIAVQVTDSAISKFHLNRPSYEKVFDVRLSNMADYALAFSKLLYARYSYRITKWAHHHSASYFLIEPGAGDDSICEYDALARNKLENGFRLETLYE